MKILGLITEYNPFHNGHLYHLNKSIEITGATHTIAVMSGNFLQRGEPALLDKWQRAKMAVEGGVDLVIELPTAYACSTAEFFALGSISLLNNLNIVDYIVFGSEEGEISILNTIAEILFDSPIKFKSALKEHLKMGLPFPLARSKALMDYCKSSDKYYSLEKLVDIETIMNNPNNILSIEYLKALKKLNSPIIPYTIPRIKAHYHSQNITSDICSATAIREHLKAQKPLKDLKKVMPDSTYNILQKSIEIGIGPVFKEDFEKALITIIRRGNPQDLSKYFDIKEGLENRIYECSQKCNSINDLYKCIKSKRYTLTRIQRICMHILLDITKKDFDSYDYQLGPQYIRVLALNDKGREILKLCKSKSQLPIINKISRSIKINESAKKSLNLDIKATNIYALALKNPFFSSQSLDYCKSPYYKK